MARDRNDSLASNIYLGMHKFAFKNQSNFNDTTSVASMSEMSVSLKCKDGRFATAAKHLADFDERSESLQWNLLA